MKNLIKMTRVAAILAICSSMAGCDDVRVYGSVGYSSYNGYGGGYHGGPTYGGSVRVGGRIY
jgi:hypothetical protein